MNKEFLKEMLKTPSVSGYEIPLQRKVMAEMKSVCDEIQHDLDGDVISILNKDSKAKVLLCGHIDEIGFVVTKIGNGGMLKVTRVGGIHPVLYLGTHVQIMSQKGILPGVVICNAGLERKETVGVEDLSIDIGARNKEEASSVVEIGDSVCATMDVQELMNDRIAGRALDDRIGAFIILEALKRAKEKKASCGIYAATTVGEETTMRGAYHVACRVQPTCALIVDVTFASDYPGVSEDSSGSIALEEGPVLCKNSMVNDAMNHCLANLAKEHHIPIQWEVFVGKAGTDGDVVHFTNGGVPIALLSIPLRYMHSSIETASYSDIEYSIQLISEFLVSFHEGFEFSPFA